MNWLNEVWAKIKALCSIAGSQLVDIWNRSKMYLLAILGIVLALEFRQLKEFFLAYSGKKEVQKDQQKDQQLKTEENTAIAQADALVKQAQQEPSKEEPVNDDWYKK